MILGLDFDGVTHPEPCFDKTEYFCALPIIEDVVREFPHVEILVTSNWRKNTAWEEIIAAFAPDIRPRVVGATPVFTDLDLSALPEILGSYVREAEITAWMRQNRPGEAWLAVDDRPYWFRPFCSDLMTIDDCTTHFEQWHAPILRERIAQIARR